MNDNQTYEHNNQMYEKKTDERKIVDERRRQMNEMKQLNETENI